VVLRCKGLRGQEVRIGLLGLGHASEHLSATSSIPWAEAVLASAYEKWWT
jgi:hypothetical protein